jgi:hypothetical protein
VLFFLVVWEAILEVLAILATLELLEQQALVDLVEIVEMGEMLGLGAVEAVVAVALVVAPFLAKVLDHQHLRLQALREEHLEAQVLPLQILIMQLVKDILNSTLFQDTTLLNLEELYLLDLVVVEVWHMVELVHRLPLEVLMVVMEALVLMANLEEAIVVEVVPEVYLDQVAAAVVHGD